MKYLNDKFQSDDKLSKTLKIQELYKKYQIIPNQIILN